MVLYYATACCCSLLHAGRPLLPTRHLPLATCPLPFATRHLQFDFNFKLKLFLESRTRRRTRQSIGNQCVLHTTLESTCLCSTYTQQRQPRPVASFFRPRLPSLPSCPYQPAPAQPRPGQSAWPAQCPLSCPSPSL